METLNLASGLMAFPKTSNFILRITSGDLVIDNRPPSPPTLRGRVGAVLILAVHRVVSWLMLRLREAQRAQADALSEQTDALRYLARELQNTQELLRASMKLMQELSSEQSQRSMIHEDQLDTLERGFEVLRTRVRRIEEQIPSVGGTDWQSRG
jgi:hypothetical protein